MATLGLLLLPLFFHVASGALLVGSHSASKSAVTGKAKDRDSVVSKVIELLTTEKGKIADDLKAEASAMEEYLDYCDNEQKAKAYAISEADRKIDDLGAIIEDNTAQIKAIEEQIVEMGAEMAEHEADFEKLVKLRKQQNEEFKKREHEQQIMIAEMANMQAALKQQMEAMTTPPPVLVQEPAAGTESALLQMKPPRAKKGMSMLQTSQGDAPSGILGMTMHQLNQMRAMFQRAVAALDRDTSASRPRGALLQQGQEQDPFDAQNQNTADNLAVFEDLKGKAESALQRERDQEVKEQNELLVEKQAFLGQQNIIQNKLDDANEDKTRLAEEKARAEGESKAAQATRDADSKFLKNLKTECTLNSDNWAKRQKEGAAEQDAIAKAIEILGSRVKVFLQGSSTRDLDPREESLAAQKAADVAQKTRQTLIVHFRNLGSKLKSLSMMNLATVASVQPMDKIKGMIARMIEKLQKEAAEAASTHQFCMDENKKNAEHKEKATNEMEKIKIRLDSASAKKDQLTDSVAELQSELKEIADANAEALKVRQEQHESNEKGIKDFKEAADAVDDAVSTLKEYYGSLLQVKTVHDAVQGGKHSKRAKQPVAPKMGGAKADSAGGILSILDMMSDEFSNTVIQLQHQEREQKIAYEKMKNDNDVAQAAKEAELKSMESEIMSLTIAIGDSQGDYKMAEKQLAAVLEYIDSLKATCEHRVVPYAERKAKREAEIEGLKEAFQILVDTTAGSAFLQK